MTSAMLSTKAAALYCRLSNADGDDGMSNSIATQQAILMRFAEKNGYFNTKTFVDDGYTGTNFNRPGFMEMMNGIERGEIGTVIVKDRSRLGRNFLETGKYTQVVFPEHGVKFIAVCNPTDADPDDSYDIDAFIDIFNSWYPKDVSRKIRVVLHSKSKNGKSVGTNCLYGYIKDPVNKNKWLVDPEASEVVKRIFKLYLGKNTPTGIATILKNDKVLTPSVYKEKLTGTCCGTINHDPYGWTGGTVVRVLKSRAYTGVDVNFRTKRVSFNSKMRVKTDKEEQEIVVGTHQAIIEETDFNTAQNRLAQGRGFIPMVKDSCPLTGLVYCADCGSIMYHMRFRSQKFNYSFCCSKAKLGNGCTGHQIRSDDLTAIVEKITKKTICYCLEDEAGFIKKITAENSGNMKRKKELQTIEKRLEVINKTSLSLYEDKVSGILSVQEYLNFSGRYLAEQEKLNEQAKILRESISTADSRKTNAKAFLEVCSKCSSFDVLTPEICRMLIAKVLVKEKAHPGSKGRDAREERVTIVWNFIGEFDLKK